MDETVQQGVQITVDGGITRMRMVGDVDVTLAQEFADAVGVAEKAAQPAVVDTRAITFMDSTGIALLARLATRTPGRLRLIDPPEVVRFLLDVTRVGDMVQIIEADGVDPG